MTEEALDLAAFVRDAWTAGADVMVDDISYGRIHWGNHEDIQTACNPYYRLLAGVALITGAKSALEIGTHWGGSARAIARGMIAGGVKDAGKIVTIDINTESDVSLPTCPESNMIQKIVGDANSPKVIQQVRNALGSVDLLYIDAEHAALSVQLSLFVYSTLLRPKVVLLDDIALNESMADFWKMARGMFPDRSIDCAKVEPRMRPGAAFGLILMQKDSLPTREDATL